MAIGDENVAIGRHRDTGRTIESIRAAAAGAHLAKHHQDPAILVELEDFLTKHDAGGVACRHADHGVAVINIADPQIAVSVHGKAVRIAKHAGAESLEQIAGGIELQDWWVGLAATDAGGAAGRHGVETAMENPDVAVAVDMHTDDFATGTWAGGPKTSRGRNRGLGTGVVPQLTTEWKATTWSPLARRCMRSAP